MPWVTPATVNTGDTLQASTWNQDVVGNSLMGNPVFANEAARDAAIPSPVEGQRCYLTAGTVVTATGGATRIPTGYTTVYNGSVWVCITPVASFTAGSGGGDQINSATYTTTFSAGTPGTNPSVTLPTGTTALMMIQMNHQADSSGERRNHMSVAVSGAGTVAASDEWSAMRTSNYVGEAKSNSMFMLTGLTAGTNTFTLQYRVQSGTIGSFWNRSIVVVGIA